MDVKEQAEKLCRWCCTPINTEARICQNCHRSQGWAGRLPSISMGVGLLVSVLAALTSIYQAMQSNEDKNEAKAALIEVRTLKKEVEALQYYALEGYFREFISGLGHRASGVLNMLKYEHRKTQFYYLSLEKVASDVMVLQSDRFKALSKEKRNHAESFRCNFAKRIQETISDLDSRKNITEDLKTSLKASSIKLAKGCENVKI
ncbi:hypothetical protein A7985_05535 [Pseudoalteromonas luteoviolacea]|uniref:Uncharacterized protein n=1 Tax=Pseudoalteromonas luteoviolacea TaxID=43657 RepID=A0A1C0TVQ7_9GAMM|nr:hypothetical protein [Pseudoalteromonas luteoviolacea]OCQ23402.1 hypothetical protein A7985_05535 [Pseudoalteromonas luteoviolacea]